MSPGRVSTLSVFAPAKINLLLAVTGRRIDGFHDLVSVAAPLRFGDTLHAAAAATPSLACSEPEVPADASNLVLRADALFATAARAAGRGDAHGAFRLEKRIPIGAGLGGGSSDGAAALRVLNELHGGILPPSKISELAAELGSDCPLFLHDGPVILRGRGERIEPLPPRAAARLRGRKVLVFKPAFGIATPWAYAQLAAAASQSYLPAAEAEARLAAWMADDARPAEDLLFNNMEPPAFAKFLALPVLLEQLRAKFGLAPRMSGSGSACFGLLADGSPVDRMAEWIRSAWGPSAFVMETALA